ncbi:DNA pilot protein [Tortoise microvirus 107]|nr:DNA pilot protein [Tortoise microvirus 107]
MSFFDDIWTGITDAFSWIDDGLDDVRDFFTGGLWNTVTGKDANKQNIATQQANTALQKEQFEHQKQYDEWYQNFSQDQLDYQKEYDATKYQIASRDASSAGINPLVMTGMPASSVGVSGGSSSTGTGSVPSNPLSTQVGSALGALSSILGTQLQSTAQKDIAKIQADTQRDVARISATGNTDAAWITANQSGLNKEADERINRARIAADKEISTNELLTSLTKHSSEMEQRLLEMSTEDKRKLSREVTDVTIEKLRLTNESLKARLRAEMDELITAENNAASMAREQVRAGSVMFSTAVHALLGALGFGF